MTCRPVEWGGVLSPEAMFFTDDNTGEEFQIWAVSTIISRYSRQEVQGFSFSGIIMNPTFLMLNALGKCGTKWTTLDPEFAALQLPKKVIMDVDLPNVTEILFATVVKSQ